ncbi:nitrite/sulfite reductase ferredoxin-like protein [Salegentibacter sp. 24]|uniref:rubredoxin domain-containing protein n=1 Tax=Salegentibacter sp. 24 TaxID=2183986 RepID=UPI0010604E5C|nr:rubredoxin domain-containing protein [Salegentibacter sp. 24]TDN86354.1 nitrite/sulfite reductase ferredoxin-like protein [Salegentibacter sp. 24]
MEKTFSRIIIKGGVLSPAELREIVELAEACGSNSISLGSRQDVLITKIIDPENFSQEDKYQIIQPKTLGAENIVSSYVAADIFPATPWLTGDRYLYVLEQFRNPPNLKVNITDPKQRLVPLFTGHLNFIASAHQDYWFLYIRLPQWKKMQVYPALIYTWDVGEVVYAIEELLKEEPEEVDMIFNILSDALETNNRTIDKPLEIPYRPFPYYEGMNKIGMDNYWLGLYWRNNKYYTSFLKDMCDLCAASKIGKISITPWKSLIIKGIPNNSKLEWEKFLGKRGINVRHSMLELNWHIPVDNEDALELKKYLVSNFDQNDISTYGLTFGIFDSVVKSNYFTTVVIEKNQAPQGLKEIKIRDTYNLLYAQNFDPNSRDYIMHVQDVDKVELPGLLIELSKMYFDQLGQEEEKPGNKSEPEHRKENLSKEIWQCKACLSIYDAEYGDITNEIAPGKSFENLPETYSCPLCEASKSEFSKKTEQQVG